jgi:hypothetical protein
MIRPEAGEGSEHIKREIKRSSKYMAKQHKVRRKFVKGSNPAIVTAANKHASKMVNNPDLNAPPVKPADVTALNQTFSDSITAATGDPEKTAAMNTAKAAVLDALRKNASYVETVGSQPDNLQLILSSGFEATSVNRAPSPLDQPAILDLSNLAPTMVLLRLTSIVNARAYQVQTSLDGGKTWQEAVISPKARRIVLEGLASASTLMVRARAVGGSTGYSPWCTSGSIVVT